MSEIYKIYIKTKNRQVQDLPAIFLMGVLFFHPTVFVAECDESRKE